MKPLYKFNNGIWATLCHLCRTIITTGKPANDLYCDRCLNERVKTEEEFNRVKANLKKNLSPALKSFESAMTRAQHEAVKANFTTQEYNEQNKYWFDESGQWITTGEDEAWKKFLEHVDKEVHFNSGDLNK